MNKSPSHFFFCLLCGLLTAYCTEYVSAMSMCCQYGGQFEPVTPQKQESKRGAYQVKEREKKEKEG